MEACWHINTSVIYLCFLFQRYRYLEAYEVDRSLQKFEQKELENATEEIASKIRAIAQWRESLVVSAVILYFHSSALLCMSNCYLLFCQLTSLHFLSLHNIIRKDCT